jgi:dCTP deaminase
MLSDVDLAAALESGELVVDPMEPHQLQPASIDLRLSDTFLLLPVQHPIMPSFIDPLDPPSEPMRRRVVGNGGKFPLEAGTFVLACTIETVGLSRGLAGVVAGKSSLARQGLVTESAGFVDPSFTGQLTLELFNMTDRTILLTPGMLICQLVVHRLDAPCLHGYGSRKVGSHYQGQRGPTPSRSHQGGGKRWRAPTPSSHSKSTAPCATNGSPPSEPGPFTMPLTTDSTSTGHDS